MATRVSIVGSLADGMTFAEIRLSYPQLTNDDISAALAYAADAIAVMQDGLLPLAVIGSGDARKRLARRLSVFMF